MARTAAVRNLTQAVRRLKRMNYRGEGWDSLRESSRGAVKQVLEEHMEGVREKYLRGIQDQGVEDRANGH